MLLILCLFPVGLRFILMGRFTTGMFPSAARGSTSTNTKVSTYYPTKMSDVLADIRRIKDVFNELAALMKTQAPPTGRKSGRKLNWSVIQSKMGEVATTIQRVEEKV